jgi:hypothetical protein
MGNHTLTNKPATTEQQVLAYQLKLTGHSIRTIADRLGCSHTWAWMLIEKEVETRKWPVVEKYRDMELGRLDELWRILWIKLEELPPDDFDHLLPLVDRIHKVGERRAKLLGLDAPVKVDATVTEVTQQDIELQEMLTEAKARASAIEQAAKNGVAQ